MSKIVEKTVNSLQAYVSRNILRGEFLLQEFTLEIGSAPSKEEETEIITQKLSTLEQDMRDCTKTDRLEECLLQAMFLEMMGQPTPFAYVHAVKLLQQRQLSQKLIGYLATSVFLDPSHELVVLLINSIQRDLASKVSLAVVMALEIIPKLIHGEFAYAVQPLVLEKTKHYSSAVRKAALLALQHCHSQCGSCQLPLAVLPVLEGGLAASEVNVVASAALCIQECAKQQSNAIGHLCSPLLEVLSQLRLKKVHSDYEFGGISAPWLQLTILSALGHMELNTEQMKDVLSTLKEISESKVVNQTIYYAILWESLNTTSKVTPSGSPLEKSVVACIAKMLNSNSTDLNYSGVDVLERVLAKCCLSEAVTCQDVIIECLHHPDESVQIKTLNLLVTMANATNVAAIVNRILKYASTSVDSSVRSFVCEKIIHLLKLYSSDVRWFATTFVNLLFLAPDQISDATALEFVNIFSKDRTVLPYIMPDLLKVDINLSGRSAPLVILLAWAFGEVKPEGTPTCSFSEALHRLMALLEACQGQSHLCLCILTSLSELSLNWKQPLQDDKEILTHLANNSASSLMKQRSQELLNWNKLLPAHKDGLEAGDRREGASVKVDTTLSFLDNYVCGALEAGAVPYKPRAYPLVTFEDVTVASAATSHSDTRGSSAVGSGSDVTAFSPAFHSLISDAALSESMTKTGLWSAQGRIKNESAEHQMSNPEDSSVANSKQEDVELMKAIFSAAPVTMQPDPAPPLTSNTEVTNVELLTSSEQKAAVSKSAELWGIELKHNS